MKGYRAAIPLGVLVALAIVLVAVTALARELLSRAGFLAERESIMIVWLVGLSIVVVVFAAVARRAVSTIDSTAGLWLLGLTAAVVASPLFLILLQRPSP